MSILKKKKKKKNFLSVFFEAKFFMRKKHVFSNCITTCFLCILHDRYLVAIALESLKKKKSIHWIITPNPTPPLPAIHPACSDYTRSLLTTQLALAIFIFFHFLYDLSQIFTQVFTHILLHFVHKKEKSKICVNRRADPGSQIF